LIVQGNCGKITEVERIQATLAWSQKDKNCGIPEDCDPVEGWIVDPDMPED